MFQPPRKFSLTFFSWRELTTSIIQGVMITAGTLFTYQYAVRNGYDADLTRTMVLMVLIAANIFLTLVNRSFYYSILTTLHYKNRLVAFIIGLTTVLTAALVYAPPLAGFFGFVPLGPHQLLFTVVTGFVSVIWLEGAKWFRRQKSQSSTPVGEPEMEANLLSQN